MKDHPTVLDVVSLTAWGYLAWTLLTWTATLEFALVGVAIALVCSLVSLRLGTTPGPWKLLRPTRVLRELTLLRVLAAKVVMANVSMARRVWSPNLPLRTGIVEVRARSHGRTRIAAIGLLTSLVVDNQVVDLDPSTGRMLYHCVDVPDEHERYDAVLGRIAGVVGEL